MTTNRHSHSSLAQARPEAYSSAIMLVAGVDGCPKGWIAVIADSDGDRLHFRQALVLTSFKDVVAATSHCAPVAVDIPIGLIDGPARAADILARNLLGKPRSSGVFPSPFWSVVQASRDDWYVKETWRGYREACELTVMIRGRGKGLSLEAFHILRKIREANEAMTPSLQRRVFEAHPEVSFSALNEGLPMRFNKKTSTGRAERSALLGTIYEEDLSLRPTPRGAARDDFYDACVLVWTADRIACGKAQSLPAEPPLNADGLRMEIVY